MRMIAFILLIISTITGWAGVGQIVQLEGNVNVIRNSTEYLPEIGFELEEGDNILTGTRSKAQLRFKDDTIVNLGRNSDFDVNSYLFDEATSKFDTKLNAKGGFFRTVTGKIGKVAPGKFQLKAKTATMGIRGTVFSAQISTNGEQIFCLGGAISVMAEDQEVVVSAGQKTLVVYGEPPSAPTAFSPEEVLYIESETLFQFETIDQETYQPAAQRARAQAMAERATLNYDNLPPDIYTPANTPPTIDTLNPPQLLNPPVPDPETPDPEKPDAEDPSESTGVTGAGASAAYRGTLNITALGSSDTVQLFGESSSLPVTGTTFTPSSYVGSERTLKSTDFYDSTGFSYTKWGSWTDTTSSTVASDFYYLNQDLVHFWVIGQRSKNLPGSSGTAQYSGYLEGVKVGASSNVRMSGPITFTMNLSSVTITSGTLTLYEEGLTSAWVTGSLSNGKIFTSNGYRELSASITGSSISSGSLLASFYGTSGTEIGGGWTITKTTAEKAQGSFITQQLGSNSATYDAAFVAGTSLTTTGRVANVTPTVTVSSGQTSITSGSTKNLSDSDVYTFTPSGQTYSTWGEWATADGNEFLTALTDNDLSIHHFVTGDATDTLPANGTATYSGSVAGNIAGSTSRLSGSLSLSADFANSQISGSMDINKYDGTDWASATLNTVSISNGAAEDFRFNNGDISGVTSDTSNYVSGQFFGPSAQEVGGTWQLKSGTETGVGRFIGKQ